MECNCYESGEYYICEAIPIFDEHKDADKVDVDFTSDVLKKIIDKSNQRIRDTGDMCPVYDGHTSDNPEDPTPPLLGFATNFKMGQIGIEDPRDCILADFKFLKEKWATVKERPRRSVELDIWGDYAIDPIALLGEDRPARDLGLLNYSKKNKVRAKYSYELKENMNPEELIKKCLETWMATPEMAFIRDLMESKIEDKDKEDFEEKKVEEKVEVVDGGSVKCEDEEEEEDMKPEKLKMQRDQERRKFAKLNEENKNLSVRLAELEHKNCVSERKSDLMQLEAEGIIFDMPEELELIGDMEPAKYSKHILHMRKRYQKGPIGVSIKPAVEKEVSAVEVDSAMAHKAAYLVLNKQAKNINEALELIKGA